MKIALVTPFGAEPKQDNFPEFILAKNLQDAGHAIRFYTYRRRANPLYRKNLVYKGINVFRARQRLGLAPGMFFSILFFRPDVVMYFHPKNLLSFTAYLAARLSGAKAVSEIVGILHDPFLAQDTDDPMATLKANPDLATSWMDIFRWRNLITHLPIAKADAIVATSADERKYIKKFYNRDSTVIPLAVPGPDPEKKSASPKNGGPLSEKFLLFIAQAKKRKGWDTVLEALAILKKEGLEKQLAFVCPSDDASAIKNYAKELGIENQIHLLSGITNEEKNSLLEKCQAVLAPSRYESFGLPVFEALRAGKPVLTTNLPIYQEFLHAGVDALISPIGDADALAQNIKLLERSPVLAEQLVENGLKTVADFSGDAMTEKFLRLIRAFPE